MRKTARALSLLLRFLKSKSLASPFLSLFPPTPNNLFNNLHTNLIAFTNKPNSTAEKISAARRAPKARITGKR